jgi:hypothetical protein
MLLGTGVVITEDTGFDYREVKENFRFSKLSIAAVGHTQLTTYPYIEKVKIGWSYTSI